MFNQPQQPPNTPLQDQLYQQPKRTLERKIAHEKLIGYLLLFIGLFMIFLSLFLVFNALSGSFKPMKVTNYKLPPLELSVPTSSFQLPEGAQVPEGFQMPTSTASTKMQIPDEIINDLIGITFYYLLMMFLASSGSKIAGIGVKMIKDIKVKV